MKTILIGDRQLAVKDYYCAQEGKSYIAKEDGKLWLYINLTNKCNATCPFCVNSDVCIEDVHIDLQHLESVLKKIKSIIYGVSITGGEPMLFPNLVDETAALVDSVFGLDVELDLVTNGTNLEKVIDFSMLERFQSIHISRHTVDDELNSILMNLDSISMERIQNVIRQLSDSAQIVLNCVMQHGGVASKEDAIRYLEKAAKSDVRNVSFVGMFLANNYCRENYVSPALLDCSMDSRFIMANQLHDFDFCSCRNGYYRSEAGLIRYYYRCPGNKEVPYARQLVYTADNRLLAGFGGAEVIL